MLMIRKAAVLGAGRMGTAVAAQLANAGIPTLLLDMAPTALTEEEQKKKLTLDSKPVRNRLAEAGIATAAKGRPGKSSLPLSFKKEVLSLKRKSQRNFFPIFLRSAPRDPAGLASCRAGVSTRPKGRRPGAGAPEESRPCR